MSQNLSIEECKRMFAANIDALSKFLEDLVDHPEKISNIANGSVISLVTHDEWVNEQNLYLKVLMERQIKDGHV